MVDAELTAIDLAASRFRPDSEVYALAVADGRRHPVSPAPAELLTAALEAARLTDGDVDPTVGRAVVELGYDEAFGDDEFAPIPGCRGSPSVTVPIDWTAIEFDGDSIRMPAGTLLDLGATAKAAAADRCARQVHAQTGSGVLVNLGGDLATAGDAPDGGWQILVQDTEDDPASQVVIGTDTGLATSSTRRRKWQRDGQAHHHIIDPRTGASADPVWRSVSVAAPRCLIANAVSTRGRHPWIPGAGMIASLGYPARLVDRDGHERTIGGWPRPDCTSTDPVRRPGSVHRTVSAASSSVTTGPPAGPRRRA